MFLSKDVYKIALVYSPSLLNIPLLNVIIYNTNNLKWLVTLYTLFNFISPTPPAWLVLLHFIGSLLRCLLSHLASAAFQITACIDGNAYSRNSTCYMQLLSVNICNHFKVICVLIINISIQDVEIVNL